MTAAERLIENGYEDIVVFDNESYDDALIGVSNDGRAVYNWELMVEWLMKKYQVTEEDAMEWIDHKTLGLQSPDGKTPIVVFPLME